MARNVTGRGATAARDPSPSSPETTTTTEAAPTTEQDRSATTGEGSTDAEASDDDDGEAEVTLVDQGFSSADNGGGPEGSWAATLENTGDAPAAMVPVDVAFADASGTALTSERVVVKSIPAGATMGVAGELLAGDILRDAEGEIVGGASTTTGSVAPGASSGEVTRYMDVPGVASADVYLTGGLG